MSWFTDNFGTSFTTPNGQAPGGYGVTVYGSNGQTGYWAGDQAIFPK